LEHFDLSRFDFAHSLLFKDVIAPILLSAIAVKQPDRCDTDSIATVERFCRLLTKLEPFAHHVKDLSVEFLLEPTDESGALLAVRLFPQARLRAISDGYLWDWTARSLRRLPHLRLQELDLDQLQMYRMRSEDEAKTAKALAAVTHLSIVRAKWDLYTLGNLFAHLPALRHLTIGNCGSLPGLLTLLPSGLTSLTYDFSCTDYTSSVPVVLAMERFTQLKSLKLSWTCGGDLSPLRLLPTSIEDFSLQMVEDMTQSDDGTEISSGASLPYRGVAALLESEHVPWLPCLRTFHFGGLPAEDQLEQLLVDLCGKRGVRYDRLE
jgi:hypothetical protein